MELCFQTTSRWRSLKIDGDVEDTLRCMSEDYRLVLPRLEELHVKQDIIDNSTWWAVSDSDTLIPSWTPPNLLIVECEEYIPSPSSALTSVNSFAVSFSLTNDEYPALIGDLFRFLSLASSITNLSLAIHATTSVLQALGLTTTVCPSVTTLGLSLTSVPFPHGTDKLLGPIVNALHMPNMISYSVVIEFRRGDLEEANRGNRLAEDLGALVIAFLPDPLMHPHLTSLNITLLPSKVNDDIYFVVSSIGRESITIPLDRIPYVSSLTVKTFTRLLFTRRSAQGTTTANGATGLGTTSSPHALRELCLQECNNISMKSLERTVDSLMDAHAFLLLDRFEVNDCRYSNMMYDNIVDIIGEDILYYKCGNILITPPVSPRSSGQVRRRITCNNFSLSFSKFVKCLLDLPVLMVPIQCVDTSFSVISQSDHDQRGRRLYKMITVSSISAFPDREITRLALRIFALPRRASFPASSDHRDRDRSPTPTRGAGE